MYNTNFLLAEPKKVIISECRGSRIFLLGKVAELSVESSNHSIILGEVQKRIEVVQSEALTMVAGGPVVPVVKVQESREVSVIGHLDAIREPLETHSCTGVTLFAVQDVPPGSTPEYVTKIMIFLKNILTKMSHRPGNSTTAEPIQSESMFWTESAFSRQTEIFFPSSSTA
jgi:hypothetical protein